MLYREKTIKSQTIYQGEILTLRVDTVELPDNKQSKREIVEHSGGVAVVAINDKQEVVLVRQYRKALEDFILELPAGKLDDGEDPLECARRELKEETGYQSKNIELLCETYPSPGFSKEKIYIYLAQDLIQGKAQLDEGEYLEVEKINIDKFIEMINNNEIKDSKTITGMLMAQNKLN